MVCEGDLAFDRWEQEGGGWCVWGTGYILRINLRALIGRHGGRVCWGRVRCWCVWWGVCYHNSCVTSLITYPCTINHK